MSSLPGSVAQLLFSLSSPSALTVCPPHSWPSPLTNLLPLRCHQAAILPSQPLPYTPHLLNAQGDEQVLR